VRMVVEPMALEDVSEVLEVDRESYTLPWPASAYRREILHNPNARYLVLREIADEATTQPRPVEPRPRPLPFFRWPLRTQEEQPENRGSIVGYAGMWLMVDEAHITTIAVRNRHRGKGLGELLLASLIEGASAAGSGRITLEVRVSNESAQALYRKYGFRQAGTRRRYYSDNNEDAYIMTTGSVLDHEYQALFDSLVDRLGRRLRGYPSLQIIAPVLQPSAAGKEMD